jgi:hypothetical protein
MRTKGENDIKSCRQKRDPLDENNDFTLGFESQTVPLCFAVVDQVASTQPALASRLWHDGCVPHQTSSEQLRRVCDGLLKTAARLIERAATLRAQAAELQKQISRLERKIPKRSRK